MVLDPLTALSLAGTVVQFVDFSSKLLTKSREIYTSERGAPVGNAELETIAEDLRCLNIKLAGLTTVRGSDDSIAIDFGTALCQLSKKCSEVAEELLAVLEKLKLDGDVNKRWKSLRQALMTIIEKKKVEEIVLRLNALRDELNLHVLVSLREELNLESVRRLEGFLSLELNAKALVAQLIKEKQEHERLLAEQTTSISAQQDRTNRLVEEQHLQTRRYIIASIQDWWKGEPARPKIPELEKEDDEEEKKFCLVEDSVLQSLRFPTIDNRFEDIEPAHRSTFEWIFKEPERYQKPWADFSKWLTTGAGIYWMNGKAASGKSTLMRFICEDPRTTKSLKQWSGSEPLLHAAHFFWNSGTADQRSQTGLLRALLFKILNQQKHLIRKVFPQIWKERTSLALSVLKKEPPVHWNLAKLSAAFEILINQELRLRICLFIDRLDEFDGDFFEIVNLFKRVTQSPCVKVCLSSRPLVDFVSGFKLCNSLRLQDLTTEDIRQYVNDELGSNVQMEELSKIQPREATNLVTEVVNRADGVFLWVKLVVRSLLRGLRYGDDINDLQKRLKLLPPILEDLFRHILDRREPVYLEHSSRLFQIFAIAQSINEKFSPTCLELSFADECDELDPIHLPIQPMEIAIVTPRYEQVENWLQTRCGGLIESHPENGTYGSDTRLSYLHRTVHDFLALPEIWELILKPTISSSFLPSLCLLRAQVMQLKLVVCPGYDIDLGRVQKYALRGMAFARMVEESTGKPNAPLLDELDRAAMGILKFIRVAPRLKFHWSTDASHFPNVGDTFLSIAIKCGLLHYVTEVFKTDPKILQRKRGRPLVFHAVQRDTHQNGRTLFKPSPEMVRLLFKHGAAVNDICDEDTAWDVVLTSTNYAFRNPVSNASTISNWVEIVSIFLDHGADPSYAFKFDYVEYSYKRKFSEHLWSALGRDLEASQKEWEERNGERGRYNHQRRQTRQI